jgi:hypothetical protein
MKRRLFPLASGLSLLLCIALCVLWAMGYSYMGSLNWVRADGHFTWLMSEHGGLYLARGWQQGPRHAEQPEFFTLWLNVWRQPWEEEHGIPARRWMGVRAFTVHPPDHREPARVLVVSDWLVALAAAVLPAMWVGRLLRRRRRAGTGRCLHCGYDLRASPERCPECGASSPLPCTQGRGPG